jgi:hypothetical protein
LFRGGRKKINKFFGHHVASRGEHRRNLIYTQTFKLAARDPAVVEGDGKKSNKSFEEDRAFQT